MLSWTIGFGGRLLSFLLAMNSQDPSESNNFLACAQPTYTKFLAYPEASHLWNGFSFYGCVFFSEKLHQKRWKIPVFFLRIVPSSTASGGLWKAPEPPHRIGSFTLTCSVHSGHLVVVPCGNKVLGWPGIGHAGWIMWYHRDPFQHSRNWWPISRGMLLDVWIYSLVLP